MGSKAQGMSRVWRKPGPNVARHTTDQALKHLELAWAQRRLVVPYFKRHERGRLAFSAPDAAVGHILVTQVLAEFLRSSSVRPDKYSSSLTPRTRLPRKCMYVVRTA